MCQQELKEQDRNAGLLGDHGSVTMLARLANEGTRHHHCTTATNGGAGDHIDGGSKDGAWLVLARDTSPVAQLALRHGTGA